MVGFIRGEMKRRVQDSFRIFLPVADAVRIFGEILRLYRIAALPQEQRQSHLILNLLAQPDKGTPSVDGAIDRYISPELMKFR